jgi:hypothetical protein
LRAEPGTIRAYFVALALLVVGFGGFYALVRQLNIHLLKERVELRRPLDSVPTRFGRWQRVGSDTVYSDTLIEELGTRSYLDRNYAIDGDPSKGMIFVHVAYYTGTIDAVPHIPERCWAVGGLEVTQNSTVVPFAIDRTGWTPLEGDDSRSRRRRSSSRIPSAPRSARSAATSSSRTAARRATATACARSRSTCPTATPTTARSSS